MTGKSIKDRIMTEVFDQTAVGICLTNEDGRFVEVNRAYCEIYGYTKDELIGKPFTLVVPENSKEAAMDLHDRFMEGEPEIPIEWLVQKKDGEQITIVVTAALMIDSSNRKFKITTVTDITHQKTTQKKLEFMEQELKTAAAIQRGLMPSKDPQFSGYSISGLSIPSASVGGDYFDFIPVDDKRLVFCLGDVAGKGMPASLLMSNLQAIIRGQVFLDSDPAHCLEFSNRLIGPSMPKDRFISLFYGVLDIDSDSISSSNAGHLPPMILSESGDIKRFSKGNLALGIRSNVSYQDEVVSLESGDILIVFSDGVVEAMSREGEEFGEEKIISIVRSANNESAEVICRRIHEGVRDFTEGNELQDDLTIIVLKKQ